MSKSFYGYYNNGSLQVLILDYYKFKNTI